MPTGRVSDWAGAGRTPRHRRNQSRGRPTTSNPQQGPGPWRGRRGRVPTPRRAGPVRGGVPPTGHPSLGGGCAAKTMIPEAGAGGEKGGPGGPGGGGARGRGEG